MENIIWTNDYSAIEALAKDMLADKYEYPELTEEEAYNLACEDNAEFLEDEKANLDIEIGEEIIVLGDLELWCGHRKGYKLLRGKTNVRDCLTGTCGDCVTWYVDGLGDLMCRDVHHDGTNVYMYRAWKPEITYAQRSYFMQKVAIGKATRKDITRYTQRIGNYVADVYGWKYRK